MMNTKDMYILRKLMALLPDEFTRAQYDEIFARTCMSRISLERLRDERIVTVVREELFDVQKPYMEVRFEDGSVLSEIEWDEMNFALAQKYVREHGDRIWGTYERPDLPPVTVAKGRKRFYYAFNVEEINWLIKDMIDDLTRAV